MSIHLVSGIGVLLLLPMAALVITGVTTFDADTLLHLARTTLAETTAVSGILALGTLIGTIILGMLGAWIIERYHFPLRDTLSWALILPLAMPTYVIAYAYTDLLSFGSPVHLWLRDSFGFEGRMPQVRSLSSAIILFSFVYYPYVYLIVRNAIADIPASTIESARLLGQRPLSVFWRVVRPLIMPAAVAGGMLVLMETLADVGATYYFGLQTFSAGIYKTWFSLGDRGAALMLAIALLFVITIIHLVERKARGRAQHASSRVHRPWPRKHIAGTRGWLLTLLLCLPILIGFLIPVAGLLWLLLREPEMTPTLHRFAEWARNSFTVGTLGATLTLLLACAMAYGVRFAETNQRKLLVGLACGLRFGYAVPGSVIALAVLWPVAKFDHALADLIGSRTTLITSTILGVLYAYLLRFFAVGYGGIEAGMQRITPNLDAAARSLGASRLEAFRRVHVPILWRSVAVAWLLLLIDIMKELPATLMLRPFDFDTLAVITQQLSEDERLAEAALPALAIVTIGTIPVIVVSRLINEPRHQSVRTMTV
ncbi:MAG: iron ABC transporter permease [Lautropia sp.]|nr:iron ABC transporter permease [Lautropia sp.]